MGSASKERCAWEDRFRTPTPLELREHYNKLNSSLFDQTRAALLQLGVLRERMNWSGEPWHWACVYLTGDDEDHPVAYLVPDRACLKLVVALPADLLPGLRVENLRAETREAIRASKTVCGGSWPVFDITSKAKLDDVMALVKRRLTTPASHAVKAAAKTNGVKH